MAINVTVGRSHEESDPNQLSQPIEDIKKKTQGKASLRIRKTLNGDLVLFDHTEVDIVVMPELMKVVAFPKGKMEEVIYDTQDRLMRFLIKKGVIDRSSIQAGNVFNSMEAKILSAKEDINPIQIAVFTIDKFIKSEKPYYDFKKEMEDREEEWLLEPDKDDSTELGEVPAEKDLRKHNSPFSNFYGLAHTFYE